MALKLGIRDFLSDIARIATMMQARFNHPVFLTTPLTSTSWDGDAYSTTAKTLIDLSAVFGVPAGVKAVLVKVAIRDSDAAATFCWLMLSPNNVASQGPATTVCTPINNRFTHASHTVPCNSDGDIYYQIAASGAGTMDVYLEIWGYWL